MSNPLWVLVVALHTEPGKVGTHLELTPKTQDGWSTEAQCLAAAKTIEAKPGWVLDRYWCDERPTVHLTPERIGP